MLLQQKLMVSKPLHRLLDKKTIWTWGKREAAAFAAVKKLLSSDSVLMQYSETLPVTLTCNASPFGVGAILSHQMHNEVKAPITFLFKNTFGD